MSDKKLETLQTIEVLTEQLRLNQPSLAPIVEQLIDAKDELLREDIKELRLYSKHLNEKINKHNIPTLQPDNALETKLAEVQKQIADLRKYVNSKEDLSFTKRKLARVMRDYFNG